MSLLSPLPASPVPDRPAALSHIVEQHADEVAFLWRQRRAAAQAPHFSLQDLTDLDSRLEAHLDGLRIAGEVGQAVCREALGEDGGSVFAATVLALHLRSREDYFAALEAAAASPDHADGFLSALGWLPYEQAQAPIDHLLGAESAGQRGLGIGAITFHRRDPGAVLESAIKEANAEVRQRALRAVGELGRPNLARALSASIQAADDPACQFWAAWSGARFGDTYALDVLLDRVRAGGPDEEAALGLALRRVRLSNAQDVTRWLIAQPERQRSAAHAAGVVGDPAIVPWLLEQMATPALARVAGEAFTSITGADLVDLNLDSEWPEGLEAGPTDDPDDEDVEMDRDEDLPWPDPERVAAWWHAHQGTFRPGTRHLLGQPVDEASLQRALRVGTQRQRAAAALEIAILHPDQPVFETRAPGRRQQQMLGLATGRL